jgi:hypothetical protein
MSDKDTNVPSDDEGAEPSIILTKDVIETAVILAHAREGYVKPDGSVDNLARIKAVFPIVNAAVVEELKERTAKAVKRSDLVSQVFPNLPGPDEWGETDNPLLAEAVYGKIDSKVWNDVKIDTSGKVQQMVGVQNGTPAMVLCQTKITKDQLDAVYVTRNLKCILADNSARMKKAEKRKADQHAVNVGMWMERIPDDAERLDRDYKAGMKAAMASGQAIVTEALETAVALREINGGDEPEPDEPEFDGDVEGEEDED